LLVLPLGVILGRDPVILNNAVILGRVPRIQTTKTTF